MGQTESNSHSRVQLKVATLNYSGILKSPYQFYEDFKEDSKLSSCAKKVFDRNKERFKFEFGPLDREWQQTRYSPLYMPSCGIKNNVHLMNQKQFLDKWQAICSKQSENLQRIHKDYEKEKGQTKGLRYYLDNLKIFDLCIYLALVEYIYCKDDEEKRQRIMEDLENYNTGEKLDFQVYKEFQREKFLKPFLKEDKKMQMTIEAVQKLNLDVLFLQQANLKLIEAVEKKGKNLRIVRAYIDDQPVLGTQSVIIIRQNPSKFPKFHSLLQENTRITNNIKLLKNPTVKPQFLTKEQIGSFNFANETVLQFLYNIILICPHLSSKKDRNKVQLEDMKTKISFLKQKFPTCHIILAGDLNNNGVGKQHLPKYLDQLQVQRSLNVVPDYTKHYTAKKMRTDLQAQPDKANKLNKEVKDYIISDLEIKQWTIQTINGDVVFSSAQPPKKKQQLIETNQPSVCQINDREKYMNELNLLPSEKHPYDHFIVTATIVTDKGLEHTSDIEYKFKYKPDELTRAQLEIITKMDHRNR